MGIIIPKMGTKTMSHLSLADALFSKTQQRVLGLLFSNPDKSFYLNEIVRSAEIGIGTVQRELEKLTRSGLLTVKKIGNQKHYQANHEAPIFSELRGIVLKTFGVADLLRLALSGLAEQIKVAFVYGSLAKGSDSAASDIDVMIIAEDLSYSQVFTVFSEAEATLGRSLSPTLYTPSEIQNKLRDDNHFLQRILEQPKIFLIGSPNDLTES